MKARKVKRIERLLSTGILLGFQQRVKASFEYLDADNHGFFTLKDLTERGRRIFLELGLDLDQGPSFSVMDNFRQFDITGKGRVRFEELGISLILRFLSYDTQFFEEHALGLLATGISSLQELSSLIADHLESSVCDDKFLPKSFLDSFRVVFYILHRRLSEAPAIAERLSQPWISKLLKDSYFEVAKEMFSHLNISYERLKQTWTDLGNGNSSILEELRDSAFSSKNSLVWNIPRRLETFGSSRRMSFEMTQASSLKNQPRRENLRRNIHSRNWDEQVSRKLHGESGYMGNQLTLYDTNTPFDDFESSLSLQQIAMLKTVQKLIETIIVGGNQEGVYEDSMYFDDPEGQRRNSLSLVINRGLTNMFGPLTDPSLPGQRYSILNSSAHSSWFPNIQKLNDDQVVKSESVTKNTHGNAPTEAELSQELMETQDLLRRTMMRLEVLELIQMQMQELDGAHLNSQLLDNDGQTVGKTTNMNELPDLTHLVDIEDITEAIQEIRILVSKRGMDNMLVGSLLSLPTAMLPLQDVNDTANFDSDHGPAKKRTLQIPELISMMETTTNALSSQLIRKAELLQELGKWKLSVQMREEKLSENSVRIEQQHRVLEGSSTLGVEIQVLRDRIHAAEYLEIELAKVKDRNVELGRKVKQLERALALSQEEREYGKVEADLRPIGESGMTEGEELIMKLRDEIADLRNRNGRLEKEQQHQDIAAKHAEQRLKMCLQDNLALHQKLNRVEEELNSTKTEISDLLGQIEHQRDVEEERLQVARKLHTTEMLVTELRASLLEARAEAAQAVKLREELNLCEARVAKLIAATSEAEIEGKSRLTSKQEIEELRGTLQQKVREIRELTINLRSMERKAGEVKTVQARLEACQEEVNRYKVKVEQCAPMLAEVARLRGSTRAAVRSLQEQDKLIHTLEESNKLLREQVADFSERINRYENLEVKLHEAESECSRLSDIVSNDIPVLEDKLKTLTEEKRQLEIQCRQLKKSGRQAVVVGGGSKASTINNEIVPKVKS